MIENNYRLGENEVSARQHDGTDESAISLAAWINTEKGKAEAVLTGEYQYDATAAYIWIENLQRPVKYIVRPRFWVVRTAPSVFFAVYPDVFTNYYKPLELIEVPS